MNDFPKLQWTRGEIIISGSQPKCSQCRKHLQHRMLHKKTTRARFQAGNWSGYCSGCSLLFEFGHTAKRVDLSIEQHRSFLRELFPDALPLEKMDLSVGDYDA